MTVIIGYTLYANIHTFTASFKIFLLQCMILLDLLLIVTV